MVLVMLGIAVDVALELLCRAFREAAVLRSVCRLFWNQMVTDFISLLYRRTRMSERS